MLNSGCHVGVTGINKQRNKTSNNRKTPAYMMFPRSENFVFSCFKSKNVLLFLINLKAIATLEIYLGRYTCRK